MRAATSELVRRLDGLIPETALILGSGLGDLVDSVTDPISIPFGDLEGFPQSGVSGHAGKIVAGYMADKPILILSGRAHYYEHGTADIMRLPIEVMQAIGVKRLILTNSAGSLREDIPPGSVMMISDHINWSGMNPLIGEADDRRFVGMTNAYDAPTMEEARAASKAVGVTLHEGIYMWFSGPSFETPAEIRMAKLLGADAVGMSTVPEVILARFCGLDVAAFSVITNFGAGMTGGELSHGETKEMAPQGGKKLGKILLAMLGASNQ